MGIRTQEDLAPELGISVRQLGNVLRGKSAISNRVEDNILKLMSLTREEFRKNFTEIPSAELLGPPAKDLLKEIRKRKEIRIGCLNYPPLMGCKMRGGRLVPVGLYGMIMQKLALAHQLKVTCVELKIGNIVQAVLDGSVDCAPSVFETPARGKKVDFTAFLHAVYVNAVVNKANRGVTSARDLRDERLRIAVDDGEIGHELILCLGISDGDHRIQKSSFDQISGVFGAVAFGSADVAIADALSCEQAIRKDSSNSLKYLDIGCPLFVCLNGVMLGKNQPALRDWLQAGFLKYRSASVIAAMEKQILTDFAGCMFAV